MIYSRTMAHIFTFILVSITSHLSLAAPRLDKPDQLLQNASRSRGRFFEVLREIDKNIPEMKSRSEAEPYLFMMKDLEKIGRQLRIDEIANSVFNETALRLTQHSFRWLRLDLDSTTTVLRYHLYADEPTAYELTEQTKPFLRKIETANRARFVENLLALEQWAEGREFKAFVGHSYRELRSSLALIQLESIETLSDQNRIFWLKQVASISSISYFLDKQQNLVLGLDSTKKPELHKFASLVGEMKIAMASQPFKVDDYLYANISEIARELISRFVKFEEPFSDGECERLTSLLDRKQLQSLTYVFTDPNFLPSKPFIPEFIRCAQILISLLEENRLTIEAGVLREYIGKLAGPMRVARHSLEGTYKVSLHDGQIFYFNLTFARPDLLVAGLGDERGLAYFAYHNVGFDIISDTFVASERHPGEDVIRNNVIRFQFDGKGHISGVLENLPGVLRSEFSGEKMESYQDLLNGPFENRNNNSTDGVYEGVLNCGTTDSNRMITLYINTVGDYQLGRVAFGTQLFFIDLPFGLRKSTKGIVYLTSAPLPGRSFIHFRGKLKDGWLVGDYIVGGRGIFCNGLALKKVK